MLTSSSASISSEGLKIADNACKALDAVIKDVQGDNKLNAVPAGVDSKFIGADITTAAGAMAIDKIIQDLTTSVQVASQILAATNKANQIVTRTLGS
jgi:hypothetical protein